MSRRLEKEQGHQQQFYKLKLFRQFGPNTDPCRTQGLNFLDPDV